MKFVVYREKIGKIILNLVCSELPIKSRLAIGMIILMNIIEITPNITGKTIALSIFLTLKTSFILPPKIAK